VAFIRELEFTCVAYQLNYRILASSSYPFLRGGRKDNVHAPYKQTHTHPE